MSVRLAQTARQRALGLLRAVQSHPSACPCHVCTSGATSAGSLSTLFKAVDHTANRHGGRAMSAARPSDIPQKEDALESQGIKYDIYSDVIIEPKDYG